MIYKVSLTEWMETWASITLTIGEQHPKVGDKSYDPFGSLPKEPLDMLPASDKNLANDHDT